MIRYYMRGVSQTSHIPALNWWGIVSSLMAQQLVSNVIQMVFVLGSQSQIANCHYSINRIFSQIFSPEYIMTFSLRVLDSLSRNLQDLFFWPCFSYSVTFFVFQLVILHSEVLLIHLSVSGVMLCTTNVVTTAASRLRAAAAAMNVLSLAPWLSVQLWPVLTQGQTLELERKEGVLTQDIGK